MKTGRKNLRDRIDPFGCPAPAIKDLSAEQVKGLHAFKKDLVAAIDRLYKVIPAEEADERLVGLVEGIIKDFRDNP